MLFKKSGKKLSFSSKHILKIIYYKLQLIINDFYQRKTNTLLAIGIHFTIKLFIISLYNLINL